MAQKEHLPIIDYVRAFAIIGVVMVHTSSTGLTRVVTPEGLFAYNFANIFFKFGTPTFILLSAFVLFYNYYDKPFTLDRVKRFYANRLLYIVIPYLVFSVVYFKIRRYDNLVAAGKTPSEIWDAFVQRLLDGSANEHLYFVIISIQFYILFPLFLIVMKRFKPVMDWAVPIGIILQWTFVLLNSYHFKIVEKGSLAISYMAYYMTGAYIGVYFYRIRSWLTADGKRISTLKWSLWGLFWSAWLIGAGLYVNLMYQTRLTKQWKPSLFYEGFWNLHTFLTAILLIQLAFVLQKYGAKWLTKLMTHIGAVSFGIYLLHPIILRYGRPYLTDLTGMEFHLGVAALFAAALLGTWALVALTYKLTSFAWILFGASPYLKKRKKPAAVPAASGNQGLPG